MRLIEQISSPPPLSSPVRDCIVPSLGGSEGNRMFFLICLLSVLFSTASFGQPLTESPLQGWKVGDRRWTVEEESLFGKWVEMNVTEDFFIRYKIPVDCRVAYH